MPSSNIHMFSSCEVSLPVRYTHRLIVIGRGARKLLYPIFNSALFGAFSSRKSVTRSIALALARCIWPLKGNMCRHCIWVSPQQ